jgi:predicted HTH domain antitoxin
MKLVNVRELKNNPSESLRMAREGPVVVLNRDTPEGLLVSLRDVSLGSLDDVRVILAIALLRDRALPLARAARVAGMSLEEFMEQASRESVPVLSGTAESVESDVRMATKWMTKHRSSPTRGR